MFRTMRQQKQAKADGLGLMHVPWLKCFYNSVTCVLKNRVLHNIALYKIPKQAKVKALKLQKTDAGSSFKCTSYLRDYNNRTIIMYF